MDSTERPTGTNTKRNGLLLGALALATLIISLSMAEASTGDLAPGYKACVKECNLDYCLPDLQDPSATLTPYEDHQPLALKLTRWTCDDNCRYECMHGITEQAIEEGSEVHQYHGKWPFHRLLGMQEPASVIFSLLNGYMHLRAWPMIKQRVPSTYYMRPFFLGYAAMGMNTWLWSAVYHSRDWPSTEKLDYFSAGGAIMFGLYYTVIRVLRMTNPRSQVLWGICCLIPFLMHISYLTFVTFDYGYNMAATGAVGLIHNLWWFAWSWMNRKERPSYAWEPTLSGIWLTLAMCLEILDFPPLWGIFDAHSLWHAATIFLVPVWYSFLLKDAEYEVRHGFGLKASHKD